jgi:hypothetical protein
MVTKKTEAAPITSDMIEPLLEDYDSEEFTEGLTPRQEQYRQAVRGVIGSLTGMPAEKAPEVVGLLVQEANRVGGVDDIAARASRDVMRLSGMQLEKEGVDEVFNEFGIKLPPVNDIKFQDYDNLDDEYEKIDGWAAQAKAAYNTKYKTENPELLAYRDDVHQRIDDTAKYMKRKVGATDSGIVDFFGRLGEGAASFIDTIGLDDTADFMRKHVATNPEWDDSVSALIGNGLGQAAAMAATVAGTVTGVGAVAGAAAGAAAGLGVIAGSAIGGTRESREEAILQATGSEGLASAAKNAPSAYAEAGIDFVADTLLLGMGKLGAGKAVKNMVGLGGKQNVLTAFGASLAKVSPDLARFKKYADAGGDVLVSATREGATEMLQGAIQDTSLGNYSNMLDKFEPFDARARAADFIGGLAGGAGISIANNFVLPKNRIPEQNQEPLENTSQDFAEAAMQNVDQFINSSTPSEAAQADTAFILNTAAKQTADILAGTTPEIEGAGVTPEAPKPKQKLNAAQIYSNMKATLGSGINAPEVQQNAEAMLDVFEQAQNYDPSPRPKQDPIQSLVPNFPIQNTEKLPTGGSRMTLSLNDASTSKAVGLPQEMQGAGSIIGKDSRRLDQNEYIVDFDAEGNPTAFVTKRPTGERDVLTSNISRQLVANKLQGVLDTQATATKNLKQREKAGITSNKALRLSIAQPVIDTLPDSAKQFASKIFSTKPGGDIARKKAEAAEYLDGGQAFQDLVDSGLTEDQALDMVQTVRDVNKQDWTKNEGRRDVLKSVIWNVAKDTVDPVTLSQAIDRGYPDNARRTTVRQFALPKEAVAEQATAREVITPTERGPAIVKEQARAIKQAPADLSDNIDIQKYVLESMGQPEASVEKVMREAQTNPEKAAAIRDLTSNYLAKRNVARDSDPVTAIEQMDKSIMDAFNVGAFKTRDAVPENRSRFVASRVADKAGIRLTADLETQLNLPLGAQPQTGRFNPDDNQIDIAAPVLRGQQGTYTMWHELAEAGTEASDILPQDPAVRDEVKAISDEIRDTPITDAKEQSIDAVAEYLYDPAAFAAKAPNTARFLDTYVQSRPASKLAEIKNAIAAEDAIPQEQRLAELEAENIKAAETARAALETRNIKDRTVTAKGVLDNIRLAIFNSAGNIMDIAKTLDKDGFKGWSQNVKNYYQVFKNRQQLAMIPQYIMAKQFKNRLEAKGVSIDNLNEYLANNRILNEKAFWEQTLTTANVTGQELQTIFNNSQAVEDLYANDPALRNKVDALTSTQGVLNSDDLLNVLNEMAAKAYAKNTYGSIETDFRHTITNKDLAEAFASAFSPLLAARGNLANTGQVDRTVAAQALQRLQGQLTPDQYKAMEDFQADVLAPLLTQAVTELEQSGAIAPTTAQFYKTNANNYVTFQLSDAIAEDPFVDAATRKQEGMVDSRAGVFETTMLKTGGLKSRAARQAFTNQVVDTYYAYDKLKNKKTIKPIAHSNNGASPYSAQNPDMKSLPIHELYQMKQALEAENPENSYVVSADKGHYTIHELSDSSVTDVLRPTVLDQQNQVLKAMSLSQAIARATFTTNNPMFAVRSLFRASSTLYRNQKIRSNQKTPTAKEVFKDFLTMPIFGIPINKDSRDLMLHSYRAAFDYMSRLKKDPNAYATTVSRTIDPNATYLDLINDPDAIFALTQQGMLISPIVGDISAGVDPAMQQQSLGAGSILSSNNAADIMDILSGTKGQKNLLEKMQTYKGLGDKAVNKVAKYMSDFLTSTRDLNNALELGEKYMGVLSYLSQGDDIRTAAEKADFNFGNPDPKGGGAAKAKLAPWMLYTTAYLNGLRNVGEIVTEGAKDPLGDQRAVKAMMYNVRNKMLTTPVVIGGMFWVASKAMGASDEEADNAAKVAERLLQNIPEKERNSGLTIPLLFRDPRSGDLIHPSMIDKVEDMDPSWTTVYLSLPTDPTTKIVGGLVNSIFDAIANGVGTEQAISNMITSTLGEAAPTLGPSVAVPLAASQMLKGNIPTDQFTGQPIVDEETYKQGGINLAMQYANWMATQLVPVIPYSKKDSFDKSKILEPLGIGILDAPIAALKMGILKENNYGTVQANQREANVEDDYRLKAKADVSQPVKNYLNRGAELEREARRLLTIEKQRLMSEGMAPKAANVRAIDMLNPELRNELAKFRSWKNAYYDEAIEQSEIALRTDDASAYKDFLGALDQSLPDSEVSF